MLHSLSSSLLFSILVDLCEHLFCGQETWTLPSRGPMGRRTSSRVASIGASARESWSQATPSPSERQRFSLRVVDEMEFRKYFVKINITHRQGHLWSEKYLLSLSFYFFLTISYGILLVKNVKFVHAQGMDKSGMEMILGQRQEKKKNYLGVLLLTK